MQTLLVGDIHACFFELQDLLDSAGLSDSDQVIALGDIIDRGPESQSVLGFFRSRPGARSLMGNHERKHLRGAAGEVKLALSQQIEKHRLGPNYPAVLDFLATLPLYLELPEALLVHGYYDGAAPLADQLPTVLCGTRGGESYLLRRYPRPWYEYYTDSRPLIVGHHDYLGNGQPFVYQERVFGLDTSCVHGKRLTGLLLPVWRFVSVPARANHWNAVRSAYRSVPGFEARKPRRPRPQPIAWPAASEPVLQILWQTVQPYAHILLAQTQTRPGYADLPPRLQTRAYVEDLQAAGYHQWIGLFILAIRNDSFDPPGLQHLLKNPALARQYILALAETLHAAGVSVDELRRAAEQGLEESV